MTRESEKKLMAAVGYFVRCKQAPSRTACQDCPLSLPINEGAEHPTFCESLNEMVEKWPEEVGSE